MSTKLPEPTREQLQAAFDAIATAGAERWPPTLDEALGCDFASRIVRARALQATHEADLRSRQQVNVPYQRPDGSWRTARVYGAPSPQLAIDKDHK